MVEKGDGYAPSIPNKQAVLPTRETGPGEQGVPETLRPDLLHQPVRQRLPLLQEQIPAVVVPQVLPGGARGGPAEVRDPDGDNKQGVVNNKR